VLIEKHVAALAAIWGEQTMPPPMRELIADATSRLEQARGSSPMQDH
jgi:hypothetical protein